MARPSSVDRLPQSLRDRIAALRREGHTIDEILAALNGLGVSRSALGRYTRKLDAVIARLQNAQLMATAIARQVPETDIDSGRVNLQMMQTIIFDLLVAAHDESGLMLDPKQVATLARATSDLSRAGRQQVEALEAFRKEQALKLSEAEQAGDIRPKAAAEARRILGLETTK